MTPETEATISYIRGWVYTSFMQLDPSLVKNIDLVTLAPAENGLPSGTLIRFADGTELTLRWEVTENVYRTCLWCNRPIYNDSTDEDAMPVWLGAEDDTEVCIQINRRHMPVEGS